MLVFLKDVGLKEVQPVLEQRFDKVRINKVVRDSDFLNSRRTLLKELKRYKSDKVVLATYDVDYLKWSFVYILIVFLSANKKAYLVDKKGSFKKLTFFYIIKISFFSILSLIKQMWDAFTYDVKLPKINKEKINKIKNVGNNKLAYIRTTDTYNLKAGGSLGHTVGMIDGFKSQDFKVHLFAIDNIEQLKVDEKTIVEPSAFYNLVNIFNRYNYNARLFARCQLQFSKGNFSFIYQRASRDNYVGVKLAAKFNTPLVLEFNSFLVWELSGATHPLHRLFTKPTIEIEKLNLERADLIVTVSEVLKDQLVEYGIDVNKVLVSPNAVDPLKFHHDVIGSTGLKGQLGIPEDAPLAGFSGTFGFWHGIDILVSSISRIAENHPDRYFILIGDGPYRQTAEVQLNKYNNVIFTGIVSYNEVNRYLSICDILLSPHNTQQGQKFIGSPTKLFEYMACEKIIIASNLDQIGEIISPSLNVSLRNGQYHLSNKKSREVGITVKPGSVEELSFAIDYAFNNIKDLHYLGKNAREKAINNHSWDSAADLIIRKLFQVLGRK